MADVYSSKTLQDRFVKIEKKLNEPDLSPHVLKSMIDLLFDLIKDLYRWHGVEIDKIPKEKDITTTGKGLV